MIWLGKPAEVHWSLLQVDLENAAIAIALEADPPTPWLEVGAANPVELLEILYREEIIGIEDSSGTSFFESSRPFEDLKLLVTGGDFLVSLHPAFRKHLQTH